MRSGLWSVTTGNHADTPKKPTANAMLGSDVTVREPAANLARNSRNVFRVSHGLRDSIRGHEVLLEGLLAYQSGPATAFYLGYRDAQEAGPLADTHSDRAVFLKWSYLWQVQR